MSCLGKILQNPGHQGKYAKQKKGNSQLNSDIFLIRITASFNVEKEIPTDIQKCTNGNKSPCCLNLSTGKHKIFFL